ncbi:YitT family protein [Ferrimonas senticii]|uniref:YitT family protein n=1 Tax=Ferrimonas senticii TaxID=394566 RepID=UPI0004826A5D|nr:YitT family protein [Ferrimonas senticii]
MNNRHPLLEDLFSLSIGVMLLSVAIMLLKQTGVMVGGVAGVALLLDHFSQFGFGLLFMTFSAPFYLMAWFRIGRRFTLYSLGVVAAISLLTEQLSHYITIDGLTPMAAAVFAGILIGVGMLVLFRHNASAGGFNVLALYCQQRFAIRAGYLLMGLDLTVLFITAITMGVETLIASAISFVLMNLVISMNHKPGRYLGAQAA